MKACESDYESDWFSYFTYVAFILSKINIVK